MSVAPSPRRMPLGRLSANTLPGTTPRAAGKQLQAKPVRKIPLPRKSANVNWAEPLCLVATAPNIDRKKLCMSKTSLRKNFAERAALHANQEVADQVGAQHPKR